MKALNFLLIGALIVLTNSCNWFDPVEPKDPYRTYHWEGTLYKGYGEEVWPNVNVNLTGAHRTLAGPKYNTIAQGVTDANGHFRLEYTIDSTDTKYENEIGASYGVSFEVGGGYPLMDAPWKVDVERDIAQNDHNRTVIIVNKGSADSVYVCSGSSVVKASCKLGIYFPLYERKFQVSACELTKDETTIEMVVSSVSKWDNGIEDNRIIAYGTTKSEVLKSFQSERIDSVPDGYNHIPIEMRGFPFTDTVYLDL